MNLKSATLVVRCGSESVAEAGADRYVSASCIVTLVEDSGVEAEGRVDVSEQRVCP